MPALRIFVVEDEALISMFVQDQIRSLGHEVSGSAAGADDALRLVSGANTDLVLMDINLGSGVDGIDLSHEIRRRFGVPSIFVTAYSGHEVRSRASAARPMGYVTKPINLTALRKAIDSAAIVIRAEVGRIDGAST